MAAVEEASDAPNAPRGPAGHDVVAGLPRVCGEAPQSAQCRKVAELKIGQVEMHGLGAHEMDSGEMAIELVERRHVRFSAEREPGGGRAVVDGVDAQSRFACAVV